MSERRVVITGYGAVSCVGNDVPTMWDSVVNGKCGITRVTLFDPTGYKCQLGGEIKNLDVSAFIAEKERRRMDDNCVYAIIAYEEARKDAGLPADFRSEESTVEPTRGGC